MHIFPSGRTVIAILSAIAWNFAIPAPASAAASPDLKKEVEAAIDAQSKQIQVMVDTIFSFAEPGFQEVRTSEYLIEILEKMALR